MFKNWVLQRSLSVASLRRNLLIAEAALQQDLNAMQQDLQLIKNDNALKSWLKDQDRHAQDTMIDDHEDWMIDPFQYK